MKKMLNRKAFSNTFQELYGMEYVHIMKDTTPEKLEEELPVKDQI